MPSELKVTKLERSVQLTREHIDAESRHVELAFSSENPVRRWFGEEILDHSATAVRLDRLKNSGPVLLDHNHREQIGVVESVSIDSDRRGRVRVRFGKSARAEEAFQDVLDGIRVHVSVGYRVHEMILERSSDEGDTYRITDWEPMEVSFVSVPADPTVGVGRSIDELPPAKIIDNEVKEERVMPAPVTKPETPAKPAVDKAAVVEEVRNRETDRIRKISALGAKHDMSQEASEFIREGKSAEEFYERVLSDLETATRAQPPTKLDMTEKEQKSYSVVRAITAAASGDWKAAAFERECSLEIQERLGKEPNGFFVPYDIQARDMSVGGANVGGNLVATQHLAGSFIDNLRARAILGAMGARFLPGLVGDVDIPRKDSNGTFTIVGEDGTATQSDINIGMVSMSPTTLTGHVYMTRKLLKQSTPSVDALVMDDLSEGAALAIDKYALTGTGAGDQPTGVLNQAGLNVQAVAAAGEPAWAELVGFETALANDNALADSLYYVMSPGVVGHSKTTVKDAGSGRFLLEGGRINDYPVMRTTQIPANSILFGNFSDVIIGLWGVLDIYPTLKEGTGGLDVYVYQDFDVAIRHAESFCKNG
ncbi:MAG: phage major capsid protein [Proteobacteria bacterium]|nr:MAG: phage major capsid protein [Pseudomonadota bacterium]